MNLNRVPVIYSGYFYTSALLHAADCTPYTISYLQVQIDYKLKPDMKPVQQVW